MRPRLAGGFVALAVLTVDQASKLWVIHGLDMVEGERLTLAPFFDVVLQWNTGISYSLFPQSTEAGRWGLVALTAVATILLAIWLWRVSSPIAAFGLGAIIGGALGNGYDRFAYGAVADFCDFHIGGWHWYVFNAADAAIVLGVALLAYDSLLASRGEAKQKPA
ncbi:MAG TPA: signal peptidase II [Roseiarcus sp.]|nr:signal peptidase II [Roseiarcus sp.]